MVSGTRRSAFKPRQCLVLAAWLWARYLTTLSLNSLLRSGDDNSSYSWCCEDWVCVCKASRAAPCRKSQETASYHHHHHRHQLLRLLKTGAPLDQLTEKHTSPDIQNTLVCVHTHILATNCPSCSRPSLGRPAMHSYPAEFPWGRELTSVTKSKGKIRQEEWAGCDTVSLGQRVTLVPSSPPLSASFCYSGAQLCPQGSPVSGPWCQWFLAMSPAKVWTLIKVFADNFRHETSQGVFSLFTGGKVNALRLPLSSPPTSP